MQSTHTTVSNALTSATVYVNVTITDNATTSDWYQRVKKSPEVSVTYIEDLPPFTIS